MHGFQGWMPDQAGLTKACNSLPSYAMLKSQIVMAAAKEASDESDIFLYRYINQASKGVRLVDDPLGTAVKRMMSWDQQQLGSCVGFGTTGGIATTQATDILVSKQSEIWKYFPAPGECYSGSRTAAGTNASWEGSTNSAALKLISEFGIPYATKYLDGKYDLSNYDMARARQWQQRGMPKELLNALKDHKLKTFYQVPNAAEAWTLIGRGYGINICSDWGSNDSRRDRDGFLRKTGRWSHSMYVCGRRVTKRKGFLVCNSWGKWMENPGSGVWPEDMPVGSFWIEYNDMDWICKTGEVIAYGDVDGFKRPKLDVKKIWDW